MSKPSPKDCAVIVRHDDHNVRAARYGRAPLVHLWVNEDGSGGTGMVMDVAQTEELIEGLNVILDEIEGVLTPNQRTE